MNTVDTQLVISSIDWPRSGWSINSIIIEDNKRKLKKYFINDFFEFFKVKIFAVTRKQLLGYLGKAVQIASRLQWNLDAIREWLTNYAQQHFGVDTWSEYLYGKKVERKQF